MKFFLVALLIGLNQTKSPTKAVFMSALLPAGGQFYNHKYIKGFFIGSVELFTGYKTVSNYMEYRKSGDPKKFSETLSYGFYFLATWLYSMADAYVDAHLYNFNSKFQLGLLPGRFSVVYNVKWR